MSGQSPYSSPTRLKILTYNTHLFEGSRLAGRKEGLVFCDSERAQAIGERIRHFASFEKVTLVGLTEVWSEEMVEEILSGAMITSPGNLILPSYFRHDDGSADQTLGNGLLLLSQYPFLKRVNGNVVEADPEFVLFSESGGVETLSKKGFLHTLIESEPGSGHYVAIYLAHAQADTEENTLQTILADIDTPAYLPDIDIRESQLTQISDHIQDNYPDDLVIVMGDLNVSDKKYKQDANDENDEYRAMIAMLSQNEDDAFRMIHADERGWTYKQGNLLAQVFSKVANINTEDQRLCYFLFRNQSSACRVWPIQCDIIRTFRGSAETTPDYMTDVVEEKRDLSDREPLMCEFELSQKGPQRITWGIDTFSKTTPLQKEEPYTTEHKTILRILQDWMKTTNLDFEYVAWNQKADIQFEWAQPDNNEPIELVSSPGGISLLQINPNRNWRLLGDAKPIRDPARLTLDFWLAHFIGHALGIGSELGIGDHLPDTAINAKAIMRPITDNRKAEYALDDQDRFAAEALYGCGDDIKPEPPELDFQELEQQVRKSLHTLGDGVTYRETDYQDNHKTLCYRKCRAWITLWDIYFTHDEPLDDDGVFGGGFEFSMDCYGHINGDRFYKTIYRETDEHSLDFRPEKYIDDAYMTTYQAAEGSFDVEIAMRAKEVDKLDDDDKLGTAVYSPRISFQRQFSNWRKAGNVGDFAEGVWVQTSCWGHTATYRIWLKIPAKSTEAYAREQIRKEEEREVIRRLREPDTVTQLASKITESTRRVGDRAPRAARQFIREEVQKDLDALLSSMELSGNTYTAVSQIAEHIFAQAYPMPEKEEEEVFANLVEVILQDVGDEVIHLTPTFHEVSGLMRKRLKGLIAHSDYWAGSKAHLDGLWNDIQNDLVLGMPRYEVQIIITQALQEGRLEALEKAHSHLHFLMYDIFDRRSELETALMESRRMGGGFKSKNAGQGKTLALLGSAWDLNHVAFVGADITLSHGVLRPSGTWTLTDTAVLGVLAGKQFTFCEKCDPEHVNTETGFKGLLPAAKYRLFSLYDASGYSMDRALRAAVDGLETGDTLVIPRVLRRRINDGQSRVVDLPLDANQTYCELLTEAKEKGIKVVIPAGKSQVDLDDLMLRDNRCKTMGTSGARVVGVADEDGEYNQGAMISEQLPDLPIGAAGYNRLFISPTAYYTDIWTGQYQATAVVAALECGV